MKPDIKCVEDLHGAFERDPEIFVALITRNLGFVHREAFCQFTLRNPLCNPERDEQVTESPEVFKFLKLSALESFVTLHFFL